MLNPYRENSKNHALDVNRSKIMDSGSIFLCKFNYIALALYYMEITHADAQSCFLHRNRDYQSV